MSDSTKDALVNTLIVLISFFCSAELSLTITRFLFSGAYYVSTLGIIAFFLTLLIGWTFLFVFTTWAIMDRRGMKQ